MISVTCMCRQSIPLPKAVVASTYPLVEIVVHVSQGNLLGLTVKCIHKLYIRIYVYTVNKLSTLYRCSLTGNSLLFNLFIRLSIVFVILSDYNM